MNNGVKHKKDVNITIFLLIYPMKTLLRRNWGKIVLTVVLLLIAILSFKTGYSYLSNDNYSPDLNPILTIQRSLQSPAWRSYRVLGFASESEQADIFRALLYYVLNIFFPTWSLSQIFALLCLFVGSWFTGLLASNLVKESKEARYSELVFLLSGIFYVSTLWTVWVYYQNMFPYITQFGFLPLLLWSIYNLTRKFNWKNALIVFVSSILFTSTCVIATLFVVDFIIIIFFTLIFTFFNSKRLKSVLKRFLVTIVLFLLTQLFWLLPFVHYTKNVSGDIINSQINRSITSSVIDLEARDQDALNSAKLFTRSIIEKEDEEYVFPRADEYAKYDFFNIVGLTPVFFTIVLLTFGIIKKRKLFIILPVSTFVIWFIIKNINPPLGILFSWAQDYIPLFKQVFRWASSKTGNIYLLLVSISAPIGFIYLIDFLSSFLRKGLKIFLFVISSLVIILPTLFYAQFLFTGDLLPQRALIEIPDEYYEVKDFIEKEGLITERIVYLPPANNNYFRIYDWGFWGSNFISYIIPNPLMDLSSAIGSKYGEKAVLKFQQAFRAQDINSFNNLLKKYDVDYILVDKTLEEEGFTFNWDWDEAIKLWEDRELTYSTDNLLLYKTNQILSGVLIEDNSKNEDSFEYSNEYSESKVVSLNPSVYDNWEIENHLLLSNNKYYGDDQYLTLQIPSWKVENAPTMLSIGLNSIYLNPALPFINIYNPQSVNKRYTYSNSDSDYIVLDDDVVAIQDLSNVYYTVDSRFGQSHSIYTFQEKDFKPDNLTSKLASSEAYECVSGERKETTKVQLQGDATGFDLKGETGSNPCLFADLGIDNDLDKIIKININWETTNDSLLGYCIYSKDEEICLNSERYFSADTGIGNISDVLERKIGNGSNISLILYTLNTKEKPEITVRNISVSYGLLKNEQQLISQNISDYQSTVYLSNGDNYQIYIPIINGENSYKMSNKNTVWQPNISDNENYQLLNNHLGINQSVTDGFANTSINLFKTDPLDRYLLYWRGENISNIPANLCLSYKDDDKCWVQEYFFDETLESNLITFNTGYNQNRLDLSMISTSYELETENTLYDLLMMKYPVIWQDLEYLPQNTNIKYEIEADVSGNSLSTTYKLTENTDNAILTIPQAEEKGWLAISIGYGIPQIVNKKVLVSGWKQGWDISNVDYNTILIIYYPNLLAYLGYLIWFTVLLLIIIKLIKKRKWRISRLYR
jgi:hypothetical protein